MTLQQLLPKVIGVTKKDIACQLDKHNKMFNYSAETGLTSYHNYTRNELLQTCIDFNIDPINDYLKKRAGNLSNTLED